MMHIKFETDRRGSGGGTAEVVQCRKYRTEWHENERRVFIDDAGGEDYYSISEDLGSWQRAYVMNDGGHTIEKIYAPRPAGPARTLSEPEAAAERARHAELTDKLAPKARRDYGATLCEGAVAASAEGVSNV